MKIDIYKCNHSTKYLIVSSCQDIRQLNIEGDVLKEVSTIKMGLDLDPKKPRIGLDYDAITTSIQTTGYHIQKIETQIKVA